MKAFCVILLLATIAVAFGSDLETQWAEYKVRN